jgi:hypothetical protein
VAVDAIAALWTQLFVVICRSRWRFHCRCRCPCPVGFAVAFAFAVVIAGTTVGAGVVAGVVIGAVVVAGLVADTGPFAFLCGFGSAIAAASGVQQANNISIRQGRQGVFLSVFLVVATVICLVTAGLLSSLPAWEAVGPLLLFMGLLTLVNAPFVWASLGFTRGLLRRGLELGGWAPLGFAVLDAALAAAIIVALTLVTVVAVQAFDESAQHSGGVVVLPLDKQLFDGIATGAPEYWWAYALLLSAMIPSMINLMIGGASLARGIPGLPSLLLRFLPAGRPVPTLNREWIALVLASQVVGGAILGAIAQIMLAFVLIAYVMPWLGFELLHLAGAVAELISPTASGNLG